MGFSQSIEPLTGLPLRNRGKVRDAHLARRTRGEVVVLEQAFDSVSNQRSIHSLCGDLFRTGKFQAILIDEMEGPLPDPIPREWGTNLEEWTRWHAPAAAGVLQFHAENPGAAILGIDDKAMIDEIRKAGVSAAGADAEWNAALSAYRARILELEGNAKVPIQCRDMFAYLRAPESGGLGRRVERLLAMGREADPPLVAYREIAKFRASFDMESGLDFSLVDQDRRLLAAKFAERLATFTRPANWGKGFRLDDARRLLEIWRDACAKTDGDLARETAEHGLDSVALACGEWMLRNFSLDSLSMREGLQSDADFAAKILLLASLLGCVLDAFPEYMRYFRYLETARSINPGALLEAIQAYTEELERLIFMDAFSRETAECGAILRSLESAGERQHTPASAAGLGTRCSWETLVGKLAALDPDGVPIPVSPAITEEYDASLIYYSLSAKRSKLMAKRTFSLLAENHWTGVILVCGGFHTSGITRILRAAYPELSWSVVTPAIDPKDLDTRAPSM
jgi:hypothetical protein